MAAKRGKQQQSVPPTLSSPQAIGLLRRQAERAEKIAFLPFNDPQTEVWVNDTKNILIQAFGEPHGEMHLNAYAFSSARSGLPLTMNMTDEEVQAHHELKTKKRKALLEGFIEQLQDLAPASAVTAPDGYTLHSEIERVSGELYRDGHYKQAALEAYIRVIDQVKALSGLPEDGDSLMNKAFGIDKQTPVIQFNGLATDAERDEQRGIMYLFKGIVGLRNSKAHSNTLFNDPPFARIPRTCQSAHETARNRSGEPSNCGRARCPVDARRVLLRQQTRRMIPSMAAAGLNAQTHNRQPH